MNKNVTEWQKINIIYDKNTLKSRTVNDAHWSFSYDKNNKLIARSAINDINKKNAVVEYTYNTSGKLTEANEMQWKDLYEYKYNLLTKKTRLFKNDNSVYSSSEFKYNPENLLSESIDGYYISEYHYEHNKLKSIIYKNIKNKTVQDISLSYNDGILSAADINTSDLYMKPEFYFKSDYLYYSWNKADKNKLRMEFVYDKQKNITEIKYFIKGDYKYSKLFIYTYY